jgi:hypothetical protein
MKLNLSEIEARVEKLAKVIDAPPSTFPTFGQSDQTGRPHIEVDPGGYHFVVAERGTEFGRYTFAEIDDLLYKVFDSITFELSCDYELAHRVEGQDFRRILFQHQVELLARLSAQWADRQEQEHEEILKEHPFEDRGNNE